MMLIIDFTFVKKKYDSNLWNKYQVACAVVMKKITAEEYKIITGEDYVEPVIQ